MDFSLKIVNIFSVNGNVTDFILFFALRLNPFVVMSHPDHNALDNLGIDVKGDTMKFYLYFMEKVQKNLEQVGGEFRKITFTPIAPLSELYAFRDTKPCAGMGNSK